MAKYENNLAASMAINRKIWRGDGRNHGVVKEIMAKMALKMRINGEEGKISMKAKNQKMNGCLHRVRNR
jgi:hypothetical protein